MFPHFGSVNSIKMKNPVRIPASQFLERSVLDAPPPPRVFKETSGSNLLPPSSGEVGPGSIFHDPNTPYPSLALPVLAGTQFSKWNVYIYIFMLPDNSLFQRFAKGTPFVLAHTQTPTSAPPQLLRANPENQRSRRGGPPSAFVVFISPSLEYRGGGN